MQKSSTLRLAVATCALICWAAVLGCETSSNDYQKAHDQPSKPDVDSLNEVSGIKADVREDQDAKQLLAHVKNEQEPTEDQASDDESEDRSEQTDKPEPEVQTIEIPTSWKRIGKKEEIWIDTKAKEVIIAGRVCLNQGALEMFICPQHTKEHESVISANATALQVHLALTALGADPGKATSWDPEYRAAFGPSIKVTLKWKDEDTNKTKTALANQWIRDVRTKKAMEHIWVFGGSQFWEDPDSKEQIYYGDAGELICLSNFSTATIDLSVESSQSNAGLLFEAFTENIPPLGTKVYAIIKPGKRIEPAKKPVQKANVVENDSTDKKPPASDSKAGDDADGE